MLHLHTERLAALADDRPTALEAEHLAACEACAAERAAHERLLALASAERHRLAPPLTDWSALQAAMRQGAAVPAEAPAPRADVPAAGWLAGAAARRAMMRIAAALTLTTGGVLAGRASAGAPILPASFARAEAVAPADADPAVAFTSPGEALAVLGSAQREYHRAAAWLAAHDTTAEEGPVRYRARLAALDQLAESSREALSAAPEDPVLNQYYLSTLSAREATIRQLGTALPAGTRLTRF